MRAFLVSALMMGSLSAVMPAMANASPISAPASSYDAFASFDGTQGAGNFYYGQSSSSSTPFALFATGTNCFITGSICVQQVPGSHDVPGVTKSTSTTDATAVQYQDVQVPTDRLLLHPAADPAAELGAFFIAPTAGAYNVSATFSVQDKLTTGVDVNFLTALNSASSYSLTAITKLTPDNLSYTYSTVVNLAKGGLVGFAFDNAGTYINDSTGLKLTVSAAPEASTWMMMILGFGLIGGVMRSSYRKSQDMFARKPRSTAA